MESRIENINNDGGATVLVADDEEPIRRFLHAQLVARDHSVFHASTGGEVLKLVPALQPDVVILDLGLPDIDGVEVIQRLRHETGTPIIVLSVRSSEGDKIAALDAGADDYLTKPCSSEELLERIRAALFRGKIQLESVFEAGGLTVDLKREIVRVGNEWAELTATEYSLLRVLVINAGRLLTQWRLAHEVWGQLPGGEALQLLRTTIASLRRKLETNPARPRRIATEPGVGFRLRTEP
jgi:two-component system KDP operon response regulator KdpE